MTERKKLGEMGTELESVEDASNLLYSARTNYRAFTPDELRELLREFALDFWERTSDLDSVDVLMCKCEDLMKDEGL
jgi:hypothetical protein